eukprot:gene6668-4777_t
MVSRGEEDALSLLLSKRLPHALSRHAVIIFHLVGRLFLDSLAPRTVAYACYLHAMKLRNKAMSCRFLKAEGEEIERDAVAVELCIVQLIRGKVMLIESCLRKELKSLIDANQQLKDASESIMRVSLALLDSLYGSTYCVFPSRAAAAALLRACRLIGLEVEKNPWRDQELVQHIYASVFRSAIQ